MHCEWEFLLRIVPDCADALEPLNETIKKHFFSALVGQMSLMKDNSCVKSTVTSYDWNGTEKMNFISSKIMHADAGVC